MNPRARRWAGCALVGFGAWTGVSAAGDLLLARLGRSIEPWALDVQVCVTVALAVVCFVTATVALASRR